VTIPQPVGYRHLRYDPRRHVLGIVTGEGAEHGAASIMALGLDPRFDLSHAYWVVAGIAGIDPAAGSIGSAAWARWVVNGDLAYEIDAREIPPGWPTGIVAFDRTRPYQAPAPPAESSDGIAAYRLNAGLAQWAYRRTAHVPLADSAPLRAARAPYGRSPRALRPPFVLLGDDLASDRFWLGARMTAWAERWMRYRTGGRGTLATTDEEDAGIMQAITMLARGKRVDAARVLILRAASDYSLPGAGRSAAQLLHDDDAMYAAYRPALEAAYRVASPVVRALADDWSHTRAHVPVAP
jgi:purine nucleoside permease